MNRPLVYTRRQERDSGGLMGILDATRIPFIPFLIAQSLSRLLTIAPTYSRSSPHSTADPLYTPKKRPRLSHNSIGDLKSLPTDIRSLTFGLRPFNGFHWSSPFLLIRSDHRPSYPQTDDFRPLIFSALSRPMGPLHSLASTVRYSQQARILMFYY